MWNYRLSQAVHMGQATRDMGEIFTCSKALVANCHLTDRVQAEIQEVHVNTFLECPRSLVLGKIFQRMSNL